MDCAIPIKERDTIIDIETCLVRTKELLNPALSSDDDNIGNIDALLFKSENSMSQSKNVGELSPELNNNNNNNKNEKRKSLSAKKPPRPPRGLSLDAADQRLIKELTELAMIKRARIERMKKMKAAKGSTVSGSSSSTGNLIAMLFTFLFCIVLIFQGCHSCGFSRSILSSSESNGVGEGNIIVVKENRNLYH